ncbi:isochorismatase family protein [Geomicrobium sp. JCM 19038]|uniref:isochorismatase family protein n=1 Tax=Geomicrobium sp. JCM 19038 TaxID=1460635 RepID=UPI00045F4A2F|nr:isochorismatase family protein [Geomicrobium sp. JCM 19038]GAK08112.1 isochorismatase [Geomicrobium sp. JCM 19038]
MRQTLLIIDAQQELIEGNHEESPVFHKEKLISNINLLIKKAIELDVSVIFVRDLDVAKGRGKGFQIHNDISLPNHLKFFDKTATNAFYETGLLNHLESQQVDHIIMAGCKTQHCIDSAVRTATINGFDVTLVGDAHSTSNSNSLSAEEIIHHHNETLHGHYNVDNFSIVRNCEENVFVPTHNSYRE